jgi:enoyl-CoA hydratase
MSSDVHDPLVLEENTGAVRHLILNRPRKANALSSALWEELEAAFLRAKDDDTVKVLVIRGAGKGFSAGADLGEGVLGPRATRAEDVLADYVRVDAAVRRLLYIWDFPKPTIAQVHGYCIGLAMQLVAVCDITVVADDARIAWPSMPGGAGFLSSFWVDLVGPKRAKEMSFIRGNHIDGATAAQWGWANRSVPAVELDQCVTDMARAMSDHSSATLAMKKSAINRITEGKGFRVNLLNSVLGNVIVHASEDGISSQEAVSELGVRGAVLEWSTTSE